MLCSNPEGLFWAGDTAQTISPGSAFRFNELKAFLFRIEVGGLRNLGTSVVVELNLQQQRRKESLQVVRVREPKMFQLSVNFRSHAGIVNCAHLVVQIITKYWKKAIDSLRPERGKADGAKPIFYNSIYEGYVHQVRMDFKIANSDTHATLVCRVIS